MSTLITFEHPLNERIRTFLRLEHLFGRLNHFIPQRDQWATRIAIETLLDIAAITARADVKNELLRELDRETQILSRLTRQPGVDPAALERVLGDLEQAADSIRQLSGPIGQITREDEFLKSIAQRTTIPGGTCSFDLPHFHHWLAQSHELQRACLDYWLSDLRPADQAIRLVLALARSSAVPRQVTAESGFFQEALDSNSPAQMVRVGLNGTGTLYPEISGHKNRFSIRFMLIEPHGRPAQSPEDVSFRLTCCVF